MFKYFVQIFLVTTMPTEKVVHLLPSVAVWRIITMMGGDKSKSMEYVERVSIVYDIDTL